MIAPRIGYPIGMGSRIGDSPPNPPTRPDPTLSIACFIPSPYLSTRASAMGMGS